MSEAVRQCACQMLVNHDQSPSGFKKKSCRRFSSDAGQKNHQFPFNFLHGLAMARPLQGWLPTAWDPYGSSFKLGPKTRVPGSGSRKIRVDFWVLSRLLLNFPFTNFRSPPVSWLECQIPGVWKAIAVYRSWSHLKQVQPTKHVKKVLGLGGPYYFVYRFCNKWDKTTRTVKNVKRSVWKH